MTISTVFEPRQEDPTDEIEELELAISPVLLRKIQRFIDTHSGGDFGGIQPPVEKTQYKHPGSALKRKGGGPPKDFSLVEDFVDLQIAVETGDFETAIPLYYKLRRLV